MARSGRNLTACLAVLIGCTPRGDADTKESAPTPSATAPAPPSSASTPKDPPDPAPDPTPVEARPTPPPAPDELAWPDDRSARRGELVFEAPEDGEGCILSFKGEWYSPLLSEDGNTVAVVGRERRDYPGDDPGTMDEEGLWLFDVHAGMEQGQDRQMLVVNWREHRYDAPCKGVARKSRRDLRSANRRLRGNKWIEMAWVPPAEHWPEDPADEKCVKGPELNLCASAYGVQLDVSSGGWESDVLWVDEVFIHPQHCVAAVVVEDVGIGYGEMTGVAVFDLAPVAKVLPEIWGVQCLAEKRPT